MTELPKARMRLNQRDALSVMSGQTKSGRLDTKTPPHLFSFSTSKKKNLANQALKHVMNAHSEIRAFGPVHNELRIETWTLCIQMFV